MLQEIRDKEYEMEEEKSLDYQNDNDISIAERVELGDEEEENEVFRYDANLKVIRTIDERIPREYKKNAVEFWKNKAKNITRSKTKILESIFIMSITTMRNSNK
jgi:hypothetical protein